MENLAQRSVPLWPRRVSPRPEDGPVPPQVSFAQRPEYHPREVLSERAEGNVDGGMGIPTSRLRWRRDGHPRRGHSQLKIDASIYFIMRLLFFVPILALN